MKREEIETSAPIDCVCLNTRRENFRQSELRSVERPDERPTVETIHIRTKDNNGGVAEESGSKATDKDECVVVDDDGIVVKVMSFAILLTMATKEMTSSTVHQTV